MPHSLTTLYRDAFLVRWALPLSLHVGRTAVDVVTKGLQATDFPRRDVALQLEDGTNALFRRAFYLRHPDNRMHVAVLSEHGGYHEFQLGPDDSVQG